MGFNNKMALTIPAKTVNEAFARSVVAGFSAQMDPTIEEISDIKTAVSEAVTNAIVHGYKNSMGNIDIHAEINNYIVTIVIIDYGEGIADIEQAQIPMWTTSPETERAGMGFTIMKSFMDEIIVESNVGKGTRVTMTKEIKSQK